MKYGGEMLWILKELYEGTETCWRAFMCVYLLHLASTRKK